MDYLYPLQNSMIDYLFCFFSSSRRHTRWPRDWSSDVCSSDLGEGQGVAGSGADGIGPVVEQGVVSSAEADQVVQVGRASCRERVERSVGGGAGKKKKERQQRSSKTLWRLKDDKRRGVKTGGVV